MTNNLKLQATSALEELSSVLSGVHQGQFDALAQALAAARRIAVHGLGREGLQMKGLGMRLFHLGLDAHVVGDMTTPPLGKGDVLLVSSGPGDFESMEALIKIARNAEANVAVVTAQAASRSAKGADHLLVIPAQTMADDQGAKTSVLPMGSLYEAAMMLTFELLVLRLRDIKGETGETMRNRHTNLE